jgi:transposase-like protein
VAALIAARLTAKGLAAPAIDMSEQVLRNWRRDARMGLSGDYFWTR